MVKKEEIKWSSEDYDVIINNFSFKDIAEYYLNSSLYPEKLVNLIIGKGDAEKGKETVDRLINNGLLDQLENFLLKI